MRLQRVLFFHFVFLSVISVLTADLAAEENNSVILSHNTTAAVASYRKGDYRESLLAIGAAERAAAEFGGAHENVKENMRALLLLRGLIDHKSGRAKQAITTWRNIAQNAPADDISARALALVGYEHVMYCELDEAEKVFQLIINEYTPGKAAALAVYWLRVAAEIRDLAAANAKKDGINGCVGDGASREIKFIFDPGNKFSEIGDRGKETEDAFQQLLDKARECDDMVQWPVPRKTNQIEAASYYLAALMAKPAARDNSAIGMRLAELYLFRNKPELDNAAAILRYYNDATHQQEADVEMRVRIFLAQCLRKAKNYREARELDAKLLSLALELENSNAENADKNRQRAAVIRRTLADVMADFTNAAVSDYPRAQKDLMALMEKNDGQVNSASVAALEKMADIVIGAMSNDVAGLEMSRQFGMFGQIENDALARLAAF